ncbi:hypothetical protein GH5_00349 [Leishmania sp. Ghana 2012 LV757]|uniref:hypothetical protein n=1 Tax=Leishmania sp. Ghana 2012 LV757 TaxID=2803181 RepID=UPI001B5F7CCF|nr:hypothetical protein GH5_00349 [Leishmania sp. Ghana 2012 LV757]
MNKVPERYHDTCAWVRHHYAQSVAPMATTGSSHDTVWRVRTLPKSEPNLDFVLERFPPPADRAHASKTAMALAGSAAQHRRSDVDKDTLEDRYNRLLLRIADDIGCSDVAE